MKDIKNQKKLFYRAFDDILDKKEQHLLDGALANSIELHRQKGEIIALRENLSSLKTGFSNDFEQKLMGKIAETEPARTIFEINPIFNMVAISGLVAIALLLLNVYFVDGSLNIDSILGINGYAPVLGLLAFL